MGANEKDTFEKLLIELKRVAKDENLKTQVDILESLHKSSGSIANRDLKRQIRTQLGLIRRIIGDLRKIDSAEAKRLLTLFINEEIALKAA